MTLVIEHGRAGAAAAEPRPDPSIRRRYVDTRFGQMHIAECGTGEPVVFLHQSPRSWTEYLTVLPVAGRTVRAIAVDSPGFGGSAPVGGELTVAGMADGIEAALDALGVDRAALVGHHTGAVVALEIAARDAGREHARVTSLVLSALPLVTPERRVLVRERPPIDKVEFSDDGRHLTELWQRRRAFYPPGQEWGLARFVVDALRAADDVEEGHVAVNDYAMPDRLPLVRARTLLLCGGEDGYSLPDQPVLAEILGCGTQVIDGAGVCLPELFPAQFAEAVTSFVAAA